MRVLIVGAIAAVTMAAVPAQQPIDSSRRQPSPADGRIRTEIMLLRVLSPGIHAPDADSFKIGHREVPAGATWRGTLAVARGNLDVRGRVTGDAIALHGDVVVYPGGSVGGNATAIDGRVRTIGGVIEGDIRSIRGIAGGILARAGGRVVSEEPMSTWVAVKVVIGWFAVLFAIGIGVLLFAEKNLDGVVSALDREFARSFWIGVLAQLATIPALLLLLLGLAITLIGILLIPFAVVAYVIVLAGLLTLGFVAIARFTGRAFARGAAESRAAHLRSLFSGLVVYLGLWAIAAAFVWSPVAGSILRAVALAGTWVALTFGLGAVILSRAGTRRDAERARPPRAADEMSWQTPTPVTGVVAARRPAVATKET